MSAAQIPWWSARWLGGEKKISGCKKLPVCIGKFDLPVKLYQWRTWLINVMHINISFSVETFTFSTTIYHMIVIRELKFTIKLFFKLRKNSSVSSDSLSSPLLKHFLHCQKIRRIGEDVNKIYEWNFTLTGF